MNDTLWRATTPRLGRQRHPSLKEDIEVDVAIVGAGITGLTAAMRLKRAGLRVAVLERHTVASGDSGNTTAHLTQAQDYRYFELVEKFGLDVAKGVARSSGEAIHLIERQALELGVDCDFRRVPGFLYAEKEEHVEELKREHEAASRCGLDVSLTEEVPLPFPVRLGLRYGNQGQFHVGKYLAALAEAIPGNGGLLFEGTPVLDYRHGRPVVLDTPHAKVRAKDVILATHTPLGNRGLLITRIAAYRTYVLGLERGAGLESPGLFWDCEDPYHYIREQLVEDEQGTRTVLIVGGKDHKTGMVEHTERPLAELEEYALDRFKGARVTYRWSGQVFEPADGLPYIGSQLLSPHLHVATGYSGTGMTFGTLAASILSDTILRVSNPWQSLYRAGRITPRASAKEYLSENKDVPLCLLGDRLKGGENRDPHSLSRGEGLILQSSEGRVAVCRDLKGKLHSVSPVCPHMGCYVHWNRAEQSWDCPCHGSRFEPDGEVVTGPAMHPLEKVPFDKKKAG